jgi:hypothetical protein
VLQSLVPSLEVTIEGTIPNGTIDRKRVHFALLACRIGHPSGRGALALGHGARHVGVAIEINIDTL